MKPLIAAATVVALGTAIIYAQLKTEITGAFGIKLGQVIEPDSKMVTKSADCTHGGIKLSIVPPDPVPAFAEYWVCILPDDHNVYWIHGGAEHCEHRAAVARILTSKYGQPAGQDANGAYWADDNGRRIEINCHLLGLALNYHDLTLEFGLDPPLDPDSF